MWPNPQFPAIVVKFAEETLNEKRHFLCSLVCSGTLNISLLAKRKDTLGKVFKILPKVKLLPSHFLQFCNDSNNPKSLKIPYIDKILIFSPFILLNDMLPEVLSRIFIRRIRFR